MQNRHDNDIREKLESMDAVPTSFNLNAAGTWQKMEEQLQPATKMKKRMSWIYWAAACLLFAVGIMMFDSTSKKMGNHLTLTPVKKETAKPQTAVPVIATVSQQETNSINKTFKGSIVTKKPAPKSTTIKTKKEEPFTEDKTMHEQVSVVQDTVHHAPITINNAATEPPAKTVTAAIKKAKLKVIHINELDAPPPPIIAKLDNKKQQQDDATDSEPTKPFWQKKPKPVTTASSFIDNQ